ncbi:hypothetical protein CK489_17770 [Bradyrhizobium sp. UFLA03-84]|nr:hypothetical protein CK489_17770 [Bradyrhizobium sp. UFLA03-84]
MLHMGRFVENTTEKGRNSRQMFCLHSSKALSRDPLERPLRHLSNLVGDHGAVDSTATGAAVLTIDADQWDIEPKAAD